MTRPAKIFLIMLGIVLFASCMEKKTVPKNIRPFYEIFHQKRGHISGKGAREFVFHVDFKTVSENEIYNFASKQIHDEGYVTVVFIFNSKRSLPTHNQMSRFCSGDSGMLVTDWLHDKWSGTSWNYFMIFCTNGERIMYSNLSKSKFFNEKHLGVFKS